MLPAHVVQLGQWINQGQGSYQNQAQLGKVLKAQRTRSEKIPLQCLKQDQDGGNEPMRSSVLTVDSRETVGKQSTVKTHVLLMT